jgi:predicted transposase YbfD/YdcC
METLFMKTFTENSILAHFSAMSDPRLDRKKRHKLSDILFIALCAMICGADDWVAIERYGKSKEEWFTKLLGLKEGIPSHDTFGNVFSVIDTEQFSDCFCRWVSSLATLSNGEIISIDGKCLRRSIDMSSNKAAIYMVSAWSSANQLVLGQHKVEDKSNEITAIPKLLEKLNIAGAVVTLDAMGCQTKIAELIIENGGNYLFSLKGNQGKLHADVKDIFMSENSTSVMSDISYDGGHGRVETRTVHAISDIEKLRKDHPKWQDLQSIIAVTSKREIPGKTSTEETRYFITSLDATDPKRLGNIVRAHWGIENNLHWVLDYAFREDDQRNRIGNSAANLAIIRHVALNILNSEKKTKVGKKTKRLMAGWDDKFLLSLIFDQ